MTDQLSSAYWRARQAGLERTGAFTARGVRLMPDEIRFVERMLRRGHRLSWIAAGAKGTDEVGTLPTNDFIWHTSDVSRRIRPAGDRGGAQRSSGEIAERPVSRLWIMSGGRLTRVRLN